MTTRELQMELWGETGYLMNDRLRSIIYKVRTRKGRRIEWHPPARGNHGGGYYLVDA